MTGGLSAAIRATARRDWRGVVLIRLFDADLHGWITHRTLGRKVIQLEPTRTPSTSRMGKSIDTLRYSEKQWAKVFDQLNGPPEPFDGKNRRRDKRQRYRRTLRIMVRVDHPGGSSSTFLVRSRDLSAYGMGFLHGGFVYPQTNCTVVMPRQDGKLLSLQGTIVRCRLLQGRLHEVGVHFNERINLADFMDMSAA